MDFADLTTRRLASGDPVVMATAFARIGWRKSTDQFEEYLREQNDGRREVIVAFVESLFAGYVTVNWQPLYTPFMAKGIPELQDLNVLPSFRRRGVATRLLDEAEELVATRSEQAGIGVGLHPGYNAAQRMYVLRGYVPDGNGVTLKNVFVREGQAVVMDDDLVFHLVKSLTRAQASSPAR